MHEITSPQHHPDMTTTFSGRYSYTGGYDGLMAGDILPRFFRGISQTYGSDTAPVLECTRLNGWTFYTYEL